MSIVFFLFIMVIIAYKMGIGIFFTFLYIILHNVYNEKGDYLLKAMGGNNE